ncbi:ribonuclease III [Mycoplasmopsis bovis]|nr:ribonuclease III [Mycoplasmopsis bovis]QQH22554.1 ribonuclease III [Mycoplasmopsis bovis]WMX52817.1 ribonuclease III [Mycoplasmopsis bovis]WMX76046.1 ribonuclease III [Mycoplasmopsis bovis]
MNSIENFLNQFNIKANSLLVYRQAFTHGSSAANAKNKNYQTLEFLGDAILQFYVSAILFNVFKDKNQGQLTLIRAKLVCTDSLNSIADRLKLKDFLLLSSNVVANEVLSSKKVGADIFESLVAAIFIDQGMPKVKEFLDKTLLPLVKQYKEGKIELKDSKTRLQEYMQSFSKKTVFYQTYQSDNNKFKSEAIYEGNVYGSGLGKSKHEAEENAANDALNKLIKS